MVWSEFQLLKEVRSVEKSKSRHMGPGWWLVFINSQLSLTERTEKLVFFLEDIKVLPGSHQCDLTTLFINMGLDSHHVCLLPGLNTVVTLQQACRGLCHLHFTSPTLFPSAEMQNVVADLTFSQKRVRSWMSC